MEDVRIGSFVRLVRHRLGWRQLDVAARSGVSQDTISRVERRQPGALQLRSIRQVLRALEMDITLTVRWRGGDLDRLAEEGHAALVARITTILVAAGWTVVAEVTYAHFGERGSIDVLAWHPELRILLVVEVKTSLTSVEETLRRHDAKVRLAPVVAADRFGWTHATAVPMLVLPDDSTARRRIASMDAVMARRYPVRGWPAFRWVREPAGRDGVLLFLSPARPRRGGRTSVARKRVHRPRTPVTAPADAPGAHGTAAAPASTRTTPPERS